MLCLQVNHNQAALGLTPVVGPRSRFDAVADNAANDDGDDGLLTIPASGVLPMPAPTPAPASLQLPAARELEFSSSASSPTAGIAAMLSPQGAAASGADMTYMGGDMTFQLPYDPTIVVGGGSMMAAASPRSPEDRASALSPKQYAAPEAPASTALSPQQSPSQRAAEGQEDMGDVCVNFAHINMQQMAAAGNVSTVRSPGSPAAASPAAVPEPSQPAAAVDGDCDMADSEPEVTPVAAASEPAAEDMASPASAAVSPTAAGAAAPASPALSPMASGEAPPQSCASPILSPLQRRRCALARSLLPFWASLLVMRQPSWLRRRTAEFLLKTSRFQGLYP